MRDSPKLYSKAFLILYLKAGNSCLAKMPLSVTALVAPMSALSRDPLHSK